MAFNIAAEPQVNLDKFRLLSRWILSLKDHQQQEAQLNLSYDRLALRAEQSRQKWEPHQRTSAP